MKIRNQTWLDDEKKICILLKEPYWSAWKQYGWEQGVEGFGISKEAIDYAIKNKQQIKVSLLKYGSYIIGYEKLQKHLNPQWKYIARDKKPIYVLPRTLFDRIGFKFEPLVKPKPPEIQPKLL